ncbi:unnamed protein product [marine sediment metagenome]|uniref:HK97 gp10 family phage protein n=1 Tax=marine sediment metagenome TaxID=412755 RepID=X1CM62_9ZZZZ
MSRIDFWDVKPLNQEIMRNGMKRLRKAGGVVKSKARSKCPVGTLSRPMYKTGRYAGQYWTARDAGALKKSIRVVEKHGGEAGGYITIRAGQLEIRVYSGTAKVYYAQIVEFYTPYLRPALNASKSRILSIMQNG